MTNEPFDPKLDETFERDLRATLDRLMAEPAPAGLRARVERTLATREGARGRRGRGQVWLGVLIALVLLGAVPIAIGLIGSPRDNGDRTPAPVATTTPSASPGPAQPSAAASGPTADQIGLPVVSVSQDVVRRTRIDSTQEGARPGGPLVGPYLYQLRQSGTVVEVLDIGGGSVRVMDSLPLAANEVIEQLRDDSGWLVVVVTPSNLTDCRYHPTTPMPWRIDVAPIGGDGMPAAAWRQVATGTEQSPFVAPGHEGAACTYALPPVLSLSGDLLAWATASSAALDAGSDVTVASLATSAKVASYRAARRVVDLQLSQQAVAWLETTNMLHDADRVWQVMEAPLPGGPASAVDIGTTSVTTPELPQLALDGTAVVAAYVEGGTAARVVRVDAGRLQPVTAGGDAFTPWQLIAADAGRVVLSCSVTVTQFDEAGGKTTDQSGWFLAVWTAADGLRTVALGGQPVSLPPEEVSRTDDWITWYAFDTATSTNGQATASGDWTAIPIDALAPPQASTSPDGTPGPSASVPPYVAMPVVSVPGLMPPTTLIPDAASPHEGGPPQGPFVYDSHTIGQLEVVDARGASVRTVTPPLLPGEAIDSFVSNPSWLVVVTSRPGRTCGIGPDPKRISWRVLAAQLGGNGVPTGEFRTVRSGTSSVLFLEAGSQGMTCPLPQAPVAAIAGDRLAIALPADATHGSSVEVGDLNPNAALAPVAKYTARQQVLSLAVSDTAVAWVESANGAANNSAYDRSVREARFGEKSAVEVPIGEAANGTDVSPGILLNGAALLASRDQFYGGRGSVIRSDSGSVVMIAPESPNRECLALGAVGSHVVLECIGTEVRGDTAMPPQSWLAVWSPGAGLRAIGIKGQPLWIDTPWVVGDQLVWMTSEGGSSSSVLFGSVPLSALDALP